ncbi:conserved hypothetical protein, partial [Ricinus communis]
VDERRGHQKQQHVADVLRRLQLGLEHVVALLRVAQQDAHQQQRQQGARRHHGAQPQVDQQRGQQHAGAQRRRHLAQSRGQRVQAVGQHGDQGAHHQLAALAHQLRPEIAVGVLA